jgi:hypothetical protein
MLNITNSLPTSPLHTLNYTLTPPQLPPYYTSTTPLANTVKRLKISTISLFWNDRSGIISDVNFRFKMALV